ncbi:ribonuclease P protein component [Arthrobacter sp.]|uniref:ribonuclease P protein component n=1 Tax=Arthrobacter sp. TaxID=1667 RepID=UPI003A8E2B5C
MLPKKHRLRSPAGFSVTVRSGARSGRRNVVLYALTHPETQQSVPSRYGFIVSKAVGNAVTRNLVKRRLRAVAAESPAQDVGYDIVMRALPASAHASWSELSAEARSALESARRQAARRSSAGARKGTSDG